jgi:ADP-ribose pyrophosphatase YjhB (NUDIX family)
MIEKRGKVWLAVSGLVKSPEGKWLVVKKRYGGLKGNWSLPAGFVEAGETADEAVLREVKEETGITCRVKGLLGLRTGVIKEEVSDNMMIFLLEPFGNEEVRHQEYELYDARYISPEELVRDPDTSVLLRFLLDERESSLKPCTDSINPGNHFGYTSYKLFI